MFMNAINYISQETWDTFKKVKKHLLTQKQKSQSPHVFTDKCQYRGNNNTSCAIGCLIPDEIYSHDMEFNTFDNLYNKFYESVKSYLSPLYIKVIFNNEELYLGSLLQNIHDYHDVEEWESILNKLESQLIVINVNY